MVKIFDTKPDAAGQSASVASALDSVVRQAIVDNGGWLPFDAFMALALYAPGLGYYANHRRQFGAMPSSGSDFVTAPELSPLFAQALAAQVAQALLALAGAGGLGRDGAEEEGVNMLATLADCPAASGVVSRILTIRAL